MSMYNALPKLTAADLEALASPTAPTLAPAPGCAPAAKHHHHHHHHHHHPRRALGPRPPRPSRRTPAHRAADRAPVRSRRLRRFLNDAQLVATTAEAGALPATRAEFRALFEPPHRTALSALSDDAAVAALWAPFVDVDEDAQARLLRDGPEGAAAPGAAGAAGAAGEHGPAASAGVGGTDADAQQQQQQQKKKKKKTATTEGARAGCTAAQMLQRVDGRIRYLFKVRAAAVRPIVQQVEDTVVGLERGESVVLRPPGALGRMVAHGVAQFHSLGHRSLGVGADRVMVVCGRGRPTQGEARLVDVLA